MYDLWQYSSDLWQCTSDPRQHSSDPWQCTSDPWQHNFEWSVTVYEWSVTVYEWSVTVCEWLVTVYGWIVTLYEWFVIMYIWLWPRLNSQILNRLTLSNWNSVWRPWNVTMFLHVFVYDMSRNVTLLSGLFSREFCCGCANLYAIYSCTYSITGV